MPFEYILNWDWRGRASRYIWVERGSDVKFAIVNPTHNETGNRPHRISVSGLLTRLGFFPAHLKVYDHSIQKLNAFSFFSWTPQWGGSQDLGVLIAAKELNYKVWWCVSCNRFSQTPYNFKRKRPCSSFSLHLLQRILLQLLTRETTLSIIES